MFSGIKSIIFGYTEPEQTNANNNNGEPTKLNQQHEEEKNEKLKVEEETQLQLENDTVVVEEQHKKVQFEEDECFNVDSWELLDLIENEPEQVSTQPSVQDQVSVIKAVGILKQSATNNGGSSSSSSSGNGSSSNSSRSSNNNKTIGSTKHIKPKKKKLVLSPSQSDFLKKRSAKVPTASTPSSFVTNNSISEIEPKSNDNVGDQEKATLAKVVASQLMPPPATQASLAGSSTSGNDSGDIAEVDESWYVTPPPCFTGSNKFESTRNKVNPEAKEAARENALIEHPSIYIASTSKQPQQTLCNNKVNNDNSKKPSGETLAKQKTIVLKKVSKLPAGSGATGSIESTLDQKRKPIPINVRQTQFGEKKKNGRSAKAWENKFIVTNWNYDDDQDDVNDDFDNLFEAEELQKSPAKSSGRKKSKVVAIKQKKGGSSDASQRDQSPTLLELSAGYESDFSAPSPALIGITDNSNDLSVEKAQQSDQADSNEIDFKLDENSKPTSVSESSLKQQRRNKLANERKAPIQVRPIEPERQPGWQLRRKRSRRRPLSVSMANTCNAAGGKHNQAVLKKSKMTQPSEQTSSGDAASNGNSSSARSSPTFIDRIGSSIVANLTNLTNGFPVTGAMPMQPRASIEEVERMSQAVGRKSSVSNLVARRRVSKAYLNRQNDCAKSANSNRRADRRLKMYTTPNGCSVNRKVQTSFH